jgi:hypothetical protein
LKGAGRKSCGLTYPVTLAVVQVPANHERQVTMLPSRPLRIASTNSKLRTHDFGGNCEPPRGSTALLAPRWIKAAQKLQRLSITDPSSAAVIEAVLEAYLDEY